MKSLLNKLFKLEDNNASIQREILGGLMTFLIMVYSMPVTASIMENIGMNPTGVYVASAFVSVIISALCGLITNLPLVLSTGVGVNVYLAYSLTDSMGFHSWQERMIILTIAGIIFLILSITPVRKKIIESFPSNIRAVVSCCLGAFIAFVGLQNGGIIVDGGTNLLALGTLLDPAVIIGLIATFISFGLMFSNKEKIRPFAIPIAILFSAVVGLIVSTILLLTNSIVFDEVSKTFIYKTGIEIIDSCPVNLPIFPAFDSTLEFGIHGFKDVFLFGIFSSSYSINDFGNDFINVLINPNSYVGIIAILFILIFSTSATFIVLNGGCKIIDKDGKMYPESKKLLVTESLGTIGGGLFGTTSCQAFSECRIGMSIGAKTGLSSLVASICFLLASFLFPVFSIFTAGSVAAPALISIGGMITIGGFKQIDFNDHATAYSCFLGLLISLLTYSISNGIGFSLITYVIILLFTKQKEKLTSQILIITSLFIFSFILTVISLFIG